VDAENLPEFLGGNSKAVDPNKDILAENVGPWNPDGKCPYIFQFHYRFL